MNSPTQRIDLNADLGEGCPNDARLLELVSSASIGCGAHAGDPSTIRATLEVAKRLEVAIGAHPGYPDRVGFGRIPRVLSETEIIQLINEQMQFLKTLCDEFALPIQFVKPHGALYNQAQVEETAARGVLAAAREWGLPLLGQPGSLLERLAHEAQVVFIAEGFPDRRYEVDGRLVPRSRPDAVLETSKAVESQIVRLVREGMKTLCIHGDDPRAVHNAETARASLERNGFAVRFWS